MALRFRLTFAACCLSLLFSGVSVAEAQDAAGQSSEQTTLKYFGAKLVTGIAVTESAVERFVLSIADGLGQDDPLEPINRHTDSFNELVDDYVLSPFYRAYTRHVPRTVRRGVSNVFNNLYEPITATSSLFAGDMDNAAVAGMLFGINSTAGVFGVMDVASDFDLVSRRMDLGATFCRYGVPSGPYLVLPILGPMSPRKFAGRFIALFTIYNSVGAAFYPYYTGRLVSEYVDDRPGMDAMAKGAIDTYALRRSVFRQSEEWLCREGGTENQEGHQGKPPLSQGPSKGNNYVMATMKKMYRAGADFLPDWLTMR